ncbi:MAG: hypothetical protein JST76_13815 [Bacteroidetes bacterium]|nr:hypothetical protein [Bacteroidota bacterium]
MSLEIVKVLNDSDGDPNKEVVILRATVSGGVNLCEYGFQDNTYDREGRLSNRERHFFQLPNLTLRRQGDTVYVYTGTHAGRNISSDFVTYLHTLEAPLFLGLDHCIWNNDGDRIKLFRLALIDEKPVK